MEVNKIQEIYVWKVYEKLARHESYIYNQSLTSSTSNFNQNKPWPAVQEFINNVPKGSIIIDAGCGPIRHEIPDCFRIGFDTCIEGLILSKYSSYHDTVIANGLYLPFRKNWADAALCISVLHHIPTINWRLKFLNNLKNVIYPAKFQQIIIYVWAVEQPAAKFPSQDVLVPWNLHEIPKNKICPLVIFHKDSTREQRIIQNSIPIDLIDTSNFFNWFTQLLTNLQKKLFKIKLPSAIPQLLRKKKDKGITQIVLGINRWSPLLGIQIKQALISVEELYATELSNTLIEESIAIVLSSLQKVIYYRYYHVFCKDELENLISKIDSLELISTVYESANWCSIIRKKLL